MTTPETMRAYGATNTVDPIIYNDIAGWSFMVEHDFIDSLMMRERVEWAEHRGVSVANLVQQRINELITDNDYGDNFEAVY